MLSTQNKTITEEIRSEFKCLVSNLVKGVHHKELQKSLDHIVQLAVQYIGQYPTDNICLKSELHSITAITEMLKFIPSCNSLDKSDYSFQEQFNMASHRIKNQDQRDLMSSVILFSLETDVSLSDLFKDFKHRSVSTSISSSCIGDSLDRDRHQLYNYMFRQKNVNGLAQNAINSFMGIQGKYLKKDTVQGRFKLDPISWSCLTEPQCSMLIRLSELGYYHDWIAKFYKASNDYVGNVAQAFKSTLKLELSKFQEMIALLQDELDEHRQSSTLDTDPELTLAKLLPTFMDEVYRMQWLTRIADACLLKKGGELVSVLYDFLEDGNPVVNSMANDLLTACCSQLVHMISKWMFEGLVDDIHGEFFIESCSKVSVDRFWNDKFRLRLDMLPKFITLHLADKILQTGRNIYFLRQICHMDNAIDGQIELKDAFHNQVSSIFSYTTDTALHEAIETCHLRTTKLVLDIMIGTFKLLDHLQGMRCYLLLGNGEFVNAFMKNINGELARGVRQMNSHNLSSILDASLRNINAQYDNSSIRDHLKVVVKTPHGDSIWDQISLQYEIVGPLASILEPVMPTYLSLFQTIWRIRHMEFVLSTQLWKPQMANAKRLHILSADICKISFKLHGTTSAILHFVNKLQHYVLFEIIECDWVKFRERMQQATALYDIVDAHAKFLDAISVGCFVSSSSNMSNYLSLVYDSIEQLAKWQSTFYKDCFNELAARKHIANKVDDSKRNELKMKSDQKPMMFQEKLATANENLENIVLLYEKAVRDFLLLLNSSDNRNLQQLSMCLDYNEFYQKRFKSSEVTQFLISSAEQQSLGDIGFYSNKTRESTRRKNGKRKSYCTIL